MDCEMLDLLLSNLLARERADRARRLAVRLCSQAKRLCLFKKKQE